MDHIVVEILNKRWEYLLFTMRFTNNQQNNQSTVIYKKKFAKNKLQVFKKCLCCEPSEVSIVGVM